MRIKRMYTDKCPVSGQSESICVEYAQFNTLNTDRKSYKKIGFECENSQYNETCDECPLYKIAPERPDN